MSMYITNPSSLHCPCCRNTLLLIKIKHKMAREAGGHVRKLLYIYRQANLGKGHKMIFSAIKVILQPTVLSPAAALN